MRAFHRATLSVALTLAPAMITGCVSLTSPHGVVRSVHDDHKMNSGRLEEHRGDLAYAKQIYLEIHQHNPQNAECSHRLGVVCTRLNQLSEADVYYRQAYAANANNPALLADMGYSAFLLKDYAGSEKLLEQSVGLRPNDPRTISNLAIARAWLKKDDVALATFRQVYTESEARRNLAAIQIERGEKDLGVGAYQLALGLELASPAAVKPPPNLLARSESAVIPQATLANPVSRPSKSVDSIQLPPPLVSALLLPPATEKQERGPIQPHSETLAAVEPMEVDVHDSIVLALPEPSMSLQNFSNLKPAVVSSWSATGVTTTNSMPPEPDTDPASSRSIVQSSLDAFAQDTLDPKRLASKADQVPSNAALIQQLLALAAQISASEQANSRRVSQTSSSDLVEAQPAAKPTVSNEEAATATNSHRINTWRKTLLPEVTVVAPVVEQPAHVAGLNGICVVTLADENRIVQGSSEFHMEYQSQPFQFETAEALNKFARNPSRYAPAAGGRDVIAVRNGRPATLGSADYPAWYRRRLYLFSNQQHLDAFHADPQKYAEANDQASSVR